jgi:HlyD family secretion protein
MLKKILLSLVAVAIVATFAGTLWFLWSKSQEEPVVYATNEPFTASIVRKAVATGSVVPRREIAIKPQVSGIVGELFVEPGQQVAKGDVIAKVIIVPDMLSLSGAEGRRNRARINLENAELEHQRNRELFAQGVISEAAFQIFETELKTAREELDGAEDNLTLIREGARRKSHLSTNTLVRATASGMVLEVPVEPGDSVIEANTFNDGTTIASVADMEEMIFEGTVDESEVGKLREGMELMLTIGAIDQEEFKATLEYISPKGVEEEGAIQFEIRAALQLDPKHFVRANYSANADIVLDRREDVLAIQESWLQFDDSGSYVEVEKGSQSFERRNVQTGLSDGITIEITGGLAEGEKIKGAPVEGESPSA